MNKKTTVDASEIEKFSKMADEWWDPKGKFRPLHQINPVRLEFIRGAIAEHFNLVESNFQALKNIKILDVGCGGGLITIPLHNMGAQVTGIDASEKNIKIASAYAKKQGLEVDLQVGYAEGLMEGDKKFDVVIALEIIEHVNDPEFFVACLSELVKPGGLLLISTMNKTLKSLALAKIGAEYILRWLPIGTHSWSKFIAPSNLHDMCAKHQCKMLNEKGISFNPLFNEWKLTNDLSVNYIALYTRPIEE